MPVLKCPNGKYRIGKGKCIYDTKAKAESAYKGYLGAKYARKFTRFMGGIRDLFKGGEMETTLSFFVPINKFDEDKRMVYGVATCAKIDNQNEIVDYEATKEALKEYSQWRNIREMHRPSAIGVAPILELRDDSQELYIGAKIVDDAAWEKCKEGVYKGFSIGGDVLDRKVELNKTTNRPINRVTKYMLNEISVVDRPANPSCRFQTIKRDTSIHKITVTEDPLKEESTRVMEKALMLTKRVLNKEELEQLTDDCFGLIKVSVDGDTIVKQRSYPMPDKVHAVNMIRKMVGNDELSSFEKEGIHTVALSVLGKKHIESECPYCIKQKLEGGAEVNKPEVKKAVAEPQEPEKKVAEVKDGAPASEAPVKPAADTIAEKPATDKATVKPSSKPAEEQKPHIKVDEDAEASVEGAGDGDKLDRIIELLEQLVEPEEEGEDIGYEENADEETKPSVEAAEEEIPPVKVAEEEEEEEDEVKAEVKPVKPAEEEEEEEDECVKTVKAKNLKKIHRLSTLAKMKAILEPIIKENKELKARIEKIEKSPLPRKGGVGDGKVKVEKYTEKVQEVRLEKNTITFSEELTKDIVKAQDLRKAGRDLTREETAFCQRVAEKMLDEKFSMKKVQ